MTAKELVYLIQNPNDINFKFHQMSTLLKSANVFITTNKQASIRVAQLIQHELCEINMFLISPITIGRYKQNLGYWFVFTKIIYGEYLPSRR
jgi:hypothetical protein